MDWTRAACRGRDPELFYPTGPKDEFRIAEAKGICSTCPIMWDCLGWALDVGDDWAILGGLTAEERRVYVASLAA
jgi:WhiB family redox-sensing transcriptional regulator